MEVLSISPKKFKYFRQILRDRVLSESIKMRRIIMIKKYSNLIDSDK